VLSKHPCRPPATLHGIVFDVRTFEGELSNVTRGDDGKGAMHRFRGYSLKATLPSSSGWDAALSRLKQGFDSPRERQQTQALTLSSAAFVE
jgi:hypothetical protein